MGLNALGREPKILTFQEVPNFPSKFFSNLYCSHLQHRDITAGAGEIHGAKLRTLAQTRRGSVKKKARLIGGARAAE